ncbi:MAG: hypothetical protein GQ532_06045, partial [Methylomarinum sp.]|nr:hypothetical protein [Methylomarinum sp.]
SETTLSDAVQTTLDTNPLMADSLLDQLVEGGVFPDSTREIPTGPASLPGTASVSTRTNSKPKELAYDPVTNTTTEKTFEEVTEVSTDYDIAYAPDSVTVSPTTTTTTSTITTTNVTNNTTNITTTTTTTSDPSVETSTETPPELSPDLPPPEPEPIYSVPYSDSPTPSSMDFYEQQYPEGMQGVWDSKTLEVNQAPLVLLIDQFTAAPSVGSCPVWPLNLNTGISGANFGTHDIAPDCSTWPIIKGIVLISAFFASRKIIFGG